VLNGLQPYLRANALRVRSTAYSVVRPIISHFLQDRLMQSHIINKNSMWLGFEDLGANQGGVPKPNELKYPSESDTNANKGS